MSAETVNKLREIVSSIINYENFTVIEIADAIYNIKKRLKELIMETKQVISNRILILTDIALSILVFTSINFSLLSPQKIHEMIQESFVGFFFKRLLFSLLITVLATLLAWLIWVVTKKIMNFKHPSNEAFFKRQVLFFTLVSLISLGLDIYNAASYK